MWAERLWVGYQGKITNQKNREKLLALPGFDLKAAQRELGGPEALPYDMRNRVRDHLLCLTGFLEGLNVRENSEIIGSQINATLRLIEELES